MRSNLATDLPLYFQGVLGPARVLGIFLAMAYLLSAASTVIVGLLWSMKIIKPFGTKSMLVVAAVPTLTSTPLIAYGFATNDINAVELALFSIFLAPAVWIIPVFAIYYAWQTAKRVNQVHRVGFLTITLLECLALVLYA